jgi:vacuolar protein sorting-associated protein 13A/C
MLEKLISSVLNRVLGNFIENLDSEQLNISLWSSTVKLENLQIKPTIFDSMPVPFTLHYGKVGRIFIDIPLMNIMSSPLKIEIADVFVFIKPKHFNIWKEQVEIDAFINKTLNYLDKYEAYLTESTQLEQQSPGMMMNLVSKIIDNI